MKTFSGMNKNLCSLARIEKARKEMIIQNIDIIQQNHQTKQQNWLSSTFWLEIPIFLNDKILCFSTELVELLIRLLFSKKVKKSQIQSFSPFIAYQ